MDNLQTNGASSQHRRLLDTILLAFHQACDEGELPIAQQLIDILDELRSRGACDKAGDQRKVETTVAEHKRLWLLTHGKGSNV